MTAAEEEYPGQAAEEAHGAYVEATLDNLSADVDAALHHCYAADKHLRRLVTGDAWDIELAEGVTGADALAELGAALRALRNVGRIVGRRIEDLAEDTRATEPEPEPEPEPFNDLYAELVDRDITVMLADGISEIPGRLDGSDERGLIIQDANAFYHVAASAIGQVRVGARVWTPKRRTATGTTITMKRACNGCGLSLGDVADEEMAAAIDGQPLPDVTGECPNCSRTPAAQVVEPVIDPDCRDGKCGSCVGGPCQHECHRAQAESEASC